MRFVYNLTVPKDTAETSPATSTVKLIKGMIENIRIRFLRGPHNQVYVDVLDGIHTIVPVAGSEPINGDGQIWNIPMKYPMNDAPYELILRGWSPDTRYQHVITFIIDLRPAAKDDRTALEQFIFGMPPGAGI